MRESKHYEKILHTRFYRLKHVQAKLSPTRAIKTIQKLNFFETFIFAYCSCYFLNFIFFCRLLIKHFAAYRTFLIIYLGHKVSVFIINLTVPIQENKLDF